MYFEKPKHYFFIVPIPFLADLNVRFWHHGIIVAGVSVVSLDKALETNHLSVRVGDNVEIKCDVTGSPVPPIVWSRNNLDLSTLNEEEMSVFSDGSLYLTKIQLQHAGNYTCHAQRNKDVVQTHVLTVHSKILTASIEPYWKIYPNYSN